MNFNYFNNNNNPGNNGSINECNLSHKIKNFNYRLKLTTFRVARLSEVLNENY